LKRPLTLVEGEGSITVIERSGRVERVLYEISEAPRYFEYIVRGKSPEVVVDLVSRICGFCGVSYLFLAVKAFEKCLGVEVDEEVDEFREVLHLAERVKSHVLHVFYMNLPEITGTRSLVELAERNPGILRRTVAVYTLSRRLMSTLGGRSHNVVNMRIGGVYYLPSREEVEKLRSELREALSALLDLADTVLSFKHSLEVSVIKHQLCLYSSGDYPHHGERVVLDDAVHDVEFFYGHLARAATREYSTALHYRINGVESYITGPVVRFNRYYTRLHRDVRSLLEAYGWRPPLGVLESFTARFAEIYDSLLRIREYLENYKYTERARAETTQRSTRDYNCFYAVEAPRGILYHKYVLDENGRVRECRIITPTAQNLAAMEDIATRLTRGEPVSESTFKIAKSIAVAFDPCISCSVHAVPIRVVKSTSS
jgi:coenzyme F420-reducing hydrogenase alpha subunit